MRSNQIITELSEEEVIVEITALTEKMSTFWSNCHGWAPLEAAELLSESRLDWQVSLSHSLHLWKLPSSGSDDAAMQILGYANLGALVEGALKLFLSVFYKDYLADVEAIRGRSGTIKAPDRVTLEPLRQFFVKRIWFSWDDWDPWIQRIQQRRNAIHAFRDRDIGSHSELIEDIRTYLKFLRRINDQLPYPDGQWI